VIEPLPRAVVPDASVILKWVLDDEDELFTAAARDLLERSFRDDLNLFVPQLWLYEVGNVLSRKQPAEAANLLFALRQLRMTEIRLDATAVERTCELTGSFGVSFYDASYLAVAERQKAVLVTADARFRRRLPADYPMRLLAP
jgi:predicted nucleic acid-binding protein